VVHSRRDIESYAALFCGWIALCIIPAQAALAVSVGGDVAVTSDFIYRGFSESNRNPAVQLDLHASTITGTFIGAWASTRYHDLAPGADFEVDWYLGQRFDLSSSWNATVTALDHTYVGGSQVHSDNYQELSAAVSYLDRWTFSVSAIPNEVRYWGYLRAGRYAAYVAETSGQWLIANGFFVTGGTGYYFFTGSSLHPHVVNTGYAYGNVGLAYEWRSLRLDVGYYLTQAKGQRLFPYPSADNRVAGTLSWRF
jgi:uncharacterized protein (TIGR02001 family)